MKRFIFIFFIILSNFVISQNINIEKFNRIDSSNIKNLIEYLSLHIKDKYVKNDISTYYDNIFRINMINKNYDLALAQIDSLRDYHKKGNSDYANAMGSQFEIYIKTVKKHPVDDYKFRKIYEDEFHKKYNSLSIKSQIILPQYFNFDVVSLKKEIDEIISKNIAEKSISIKEAMLLCRKYNSYNVAKKSFAYANKFLQQQDKKNFTIKDSLIIKTKNNHEITIRAVLNNKIKKSSPTIIVNSIYSDPFDINEAREIASYGYNCVYINTRGKYLSNDKIEPFEHEAEDINEIINWITKQPWSNGKVGMIGGSYLGFSQWAATKKLHPALKTIIPQVAVGIGVDYPMVNNVFMSYMLKWLDYVTTNKTTNDESFSDKEKWKEIYKKWYLSGEPFNKLDSISGQKNEIFQRWLQHPSYDSYWQGMTPDSNEFSNINIPILTTTGYFDADQIGALHYYKNHLKYNKEANHYMIIGPYDHSGGQGNIKSEIEGLKIDKVANINLNQICYQWFDYILKNKKKPDFLKGKINYEIVGKNIWKSTNSLDEFDNKTKYYLNENLTLNQGTNKHLDFSKLTVDFSDRKDIDKQLKYDYNVISDSLLLTNNYLQYFTKPFDKEVEFTGNFSGNLNFSINKKDCDISMYLYEALPNGKYFLLSYYIGRASYANDNTKRQLLKPNEKVSIPIKNTTFVSKKIEKGSKIILLLGINKNPSWQVNYGSGKDVSTETIADAKEPLEIKWYNDSYIEFPISSQ